MLRFCFLASTVAFTLLLPSPLLASVTTTGDIDPTTAPETWDASTNAYIGKTADGTMTINGGNDVVSKSGYLGKDSGGFGEVVVDGIGSTWNNESSLRIGGYGSGTLTITNGGTVTNTVGQIIAYNSSLSSVVTVDGAGSTWDNSDYLSISRKGTLNITNGGVVTAKDTYITHDDYCTGIINFGSNGGTLTTGTLFASPTQLTGTGTINAQGSVSDIDLVFDAAHGRNQTLTLNEAGQNITLNLDVSSGTGDLGVGYKDTGATMIIKDGMIVSSASGCIGRESGSSGAVTVDGINSAWNNSSSLYVGEYGNGTLNITNGATVTAKSTYVSYSMAFTYDNNDPSSGSINFGDNGGTLTTETFSASPSQLTGTGTINTQGLVSDVDLAFDATHGLAQSLTLNEPGQNITLNFDLSNANELGVGYRENGSMVIKDGVTVSTTGGSVGIATGSSGEVTVDGTNSTWNNSANVYIGLLGNGKLTISNGGTVNNDYASIGDGPGGSSGEATVDGTNSTWNSQWGLCVGGYGDGKLSITNGGVVNSQFGNIGAVEESLSNVIVDGAGSTWNMRYASYVGNEGSGVLQITNGGLVCVGGEVTIDKNKDGDSFINMATGGMLALMGERDDSLTRFLDLTKGTRDIRYWNDSLDDWAPLTTATYGDDYTLEYLTEGDLAGYTLLTVGTVPEPSSFTLLLLAVGFGAMLKTRGDKPRR